MGMDQTIKDVIKLDDYTVKFTLSKPEASFLSNLAMEFSSILSAEYGDKLLKEKIPQQLRRYNLWEQALSFSKNMKKIPSFVSLPTRTISLALHL